MINVSKTAKVRATIMALALGLVPALQANATEYSLNFNASGGVERTGTVNGQSVAYRAYEGIVYVKRPVDLQYQTMNVYVPADYYAGKTVNGFTADTAPIFFPNSVGGYMPGAASTPGSGMDAENNTILSALAQGLVVAAPGARGRTLKAADGTYTGKAPASIVDLKAAVRYLRYNDKAMPGNAERIVSNGTSAGGALSALLGSNGNSADYEPYLKALGAAEARDDIWAVSAYCPITNLDNADAAYEWLFGDLRQTKSSGMMMGGMMPPGATGPWGAPQASSGPLTEAQIALSARFKALFPTYVNSLGLKKADGTALTLDAAGNGSFRDYAKSLLVASAQKAAQSGTDLSKLSWVKIANGKVTDIDWAGYIAYCGRKKAVPSFDALDLSSGENNEFGTATVDNQHFTAFGQANNTATGATNVDAKTVKMMNPMSYIGARDSVTAKYWRIRHGTVDSDTALAIPTILATRLANSGYSVDFGLPWDRPHSGDYDLTELFDWIKQIAK